MGETSKTVEDPVCSGSFWTCVDTVHATAKSNAAPFQKTGVWHSFDHRQIDTSAMISVDAQDAPGQEEKHVDDCPTTDAIPNRR